MLILTIERKSEDQLSAAQAKVMRKQRGRTPSGSGSKGREFAATMLGYVTADTMWDHGRSSDSRRPVFLYLTGPATSLRPFVANLQEGKRAVQTDTTARNSSSSDTPIRYELLRTGGYMYKWQHLDDEPRSALLTAYQPALFGLDPGMIPDAIRFISMPPRQWISESREWLDRHPGERAAILAHARALGVLADGVQPRQDAHGAMLPGAAHLPADDVLDLALRAVHFTAHLAHRTALPLPTALPFALQLLLAMLHPSTALASLPTNDTYSYSRRQEPNISDPWWWARQPSFAPLVAPFNSQINLLPPIACRSSHADFELVLARETQRYFALGAGDLDGQALPPLPLPVGSQNTVDGVDVGVDVMDKEY